MTKLLMRQGLKWVEIDTGREAWSSFPDKGSVYENLEAPSIDEAEENGRNYIKNYEHRTWPGGMGQLIGVVKTDEQAYSPVISTYYSNS